MSIHTTPLPYADQPGPEAAQPAQRASRFDERGVALQTVIIMVVLLAIAGTVAAVLLSRTGEVTGELENTDVTATRIDTAVECGRYVMGGIEGSPKPNSALATSCEWEEENGGDTTLTNGKCILVGGQFTSAANPSSGKDKCVVMF